MSAEQPIESTDIPPEIDDLYEGEWIAWDTITREVVAHHVELKQVVQLARPTQAKGHTIYFHHILPPDAVLVGGFDVLCPVPTSFARGCRWRCEVLP